MSDHLQEQLSASALKTALDRLAKQAATETARAISLHPDPMHSGHEAYGVILEELDEFWDLVRLNPKRLNEEQRGQLRLDMREELIQTAAMCLRAILNLGLGEAQPEPDDPLAMYILRHFADAGEDAQTQRNRAEAAARDYRLHMERETEQAKRASDQNKRAAEPKMEWRT